MKIIDIPEVDIEVELLGRTDLQPIKFKKWLQETIDAYPESQKTQDQARESALIATKIKEADTSINLENSEYKIVKAACEAPGVLNGGIKRQILPYFDAVNNAQDPDAKNKE